MLVLKLDHPCYRDWPTSQKSSWFSFKLQITVVAWWIQLHRQELCVLFCKFKEGLQPKQLHSTFKTESTMNGTLIMWAASYCKLIGSETMFYWSQREN